MRALFILSILSLSLFIACSTDDDTPQAASQANEGVPEIFWSETINGLGSIDVKIDNEGSLSVSGDYTGSSGIEGLQQVTTGIRNGFFLQYNNSGTTTSVMDLGLQVFKDLNDMEFRPNGHAVLAGVAVDFQNVMYLEVDPDSETQISNQSVPGSGNDRIGGIAIDNLGNTLIGGRFNGTVTFTEDGIAVGAILGTAMIAKFDASGEPVWLYASPIPTASSLEGLDVDEEGNVYCYECAADLIYLRKLSPSGELLFTVENLGRCGTGLKVVSSSEIYINTAFNVKRLDGGGNEVWTVTTSTQLEDIDVANGRIAVAGRNFSAGTFGPVELPGRSDTFMAQLNTDGTVQWVATEIGASDISINDRGEVAFANAQTGAIGVLKP